MYDQNIKSIEESFGLTRDVMLNLENEANFSSLVLLATSSKAIFKALKDVLPEGLNVAGNINSALIVLSKDTSVIYPVYKSLLNIVKSRDIQGVADQVSFSNDLIAFKDASQSEKIKMLYSLSLDIKNETDKFYKLPSCLWYSMCIKDLPFKKHLEDVDIYNLVHSILAPYILLVVIYQASMRNGSYCGLQKNEVESCAISAEIIYTKLFTINQENIIKSFLGDNLDSFNLALSAAYEAQEQTIH